MALEELVKRPGKVGCGKQVGLSANCPAFRELGRVGSDVWATVSGQTFIRTQIPITMCGVWGLSGYTPSRAHSLEMHAHKVPGSLLEAGISQWLDRPGPYIMEGRNGQRQTTRNLVIKSDCILKNLNRIIVKDLAWEVGRGKFFLFYF